MLSGIAAAEDGGRAVSIIAHRGASAYAPENTLAAFRLADELGADWFELDCRFSSDDEVVVMHDDSVERTTDGEGHVRALTLAELKALDAGSWKGPEFAGERIPTLAEALDCAKDAIGVYIEVKGSADHALRARIIEALGDGAGCGADTMRVIMDAIEADGTRNLLLTRRVIELVRGRDMTEQVVIQSFSPIVCAVALAEAPEIRTELLGADDPEKPEVWKRYLWWAKVLGVPGCNVDGKSLNRERLAAFHETGRSVAVWTVDEPAAMKRYATWGVDGIITNRPDVCAGVLSELGLRRPGK